jgi:hypothetical protein
MFSKSLLALAVAGAMVSGAAFAAVPPTQIVMTQDPSDPTTYTGSFFATAANNVYNVTFPTGAYNLFTTITASHYKTTGFDVTGATFDGLSFTPELNTTTPIRNSTQTITVDYWTYSADNITAGLHSVVVTGVPYSGSGAGLFNVSVSAVPEPGTISMMLAGLALVGGLQLRRKNKNTALAG